MTNIELLDTYKKACNWTIKRMQVNKTNKNELGQPYDHEEFMIALNKIEQMEDEMNKRGLIYG